MLANASVSPGPALYRTYLVTGQPAGYASVSATVDVYAGEAAYVTLSPLVTDGPLGVENGILQAGIEGMAFDRPLMATGGAPPAIPRRRRSCRRARRWARGRDSPA